MAQASDGQIEFEQLGIASVLKRYQLVVPPNQREYAWEKGHVQRLFQDLSRAIGDGDSSYFLGTVVTIRRDGHLEVVDGQQRLATTALLIHAMARYLSSLDSELAESLRSDFLVKFDRSKREKVPRVTLNAVDNHFFRGVITDSDPRPPATKPSHTLISDSSNRAREQVTDIVAKFAEPDHGDELNRWVTFLEERAKVVLLIVSDDANAYRMFETLNDRGLRVSQADLIKNYLYGRAGDRLEEATTKWSLVRGALEGLDDDDATIDFLRHALTARSGFVREADLYKRVESSVRSSQQVITFLSDLEQLASKYVAIQNPEHEAWNKHPKTTRRAIEVLSLFDIKPMRPLALAVGHRMTPKEGDLALRMLVSLSARLSTVGGTRTGSLETALALAASKVYSKDIKTCAQLRQNLKDVTPSDAVFKERFATSKVSVGKLARYFLRSLEDGYKGTSDPWWTPTDDPAVINLEHVLPRNPLGNWPQFGADEDAAPYKMRLGNQALVLAEDNSGSQSDAFTDKLPMFVKSSYHFTQMIGKATQWTPAEIESRQKEMADSAVAVWKV